jgi:hypothetical protein
MNWNFICNIMCVNLYKKYYVFIATNFNCLEARNLWAYRECRLLRADDEKKVMSIRLYLFSWMTIVSPYYVFRWPCKLCNIEILSCIVPIPLFWQRSMSYCLHLHLFLRLINLHSRYAQRFRASKQLKLVAIKT